MSLITIALLAQLAAPVRVLPVLSFPERGLDDSAAYQGYQTRLFRDASGNTVQVYLDARADRVVHLWADAEDESFGFTARGTGGRPAGLEWNRADALISRSAHSRTVEHALVGNGARIDLGWFQLGSMRVERDLQYANRQKAAFAEAPFALPELGRLMSALESLGPDAQRAHLALLHAASLGDLRARLRPAVTSRGSATAWVTRVTQPALDGRDTRVMELLTDPRRVVASVEGDSVSVRAVAPADLQPVVPRLSRRIPIRWRAQRRSRRASRAAARAAGSWPRVALVAREADGGPPDLRHVFRS